MSGLALLLECASSSRAGTRISLGWQCADTCFAVADCVPLPQRVYLTLSASVGGQTYTDLSLAGNNIVDVQWTWTDWPGRWTTNPVAPVISNPRSMRASFMPDRATDSTQYVLTVTVNTGCGVPVTKTVSASVGCSVSLPPPSVTLVLDTGSQHRFGVNGSLYVVSQPNAQGYTPETVLWVGEPNCPSVLQSNWYATGCCCVVACRWRHWIVN